MPFREYVDKMTVRFAGNNPPDIVHLPTRNYLAFASQGWLAPLDEYLAQTDVKATYMKLNDEMLYDGKYYGVLMMGYGMMFYYNEKMLADAKVAGAEDQRRAAEGDRRDDRCQRGPLRLGRADQRASQRLRRDLHVGDRRGREPVQGQPVQLHRSGGDPRHRQVPHRGEERAERLVERTGAATFIDGKVAMIRDGPWVAAAREESAGGDAGQSQDGHDAVRERFPAGPAIRCTCRPSSIRKSASSSGNSSG